MFKNVVGKENLSQFSIIGLFSINIEWKILNKFNNINQI